ncbi:MAG TPA: erythromycin esterase family protein [Gemmatimonadales bacterium]|nr:erythromycin esterase family protein [Gemmatimonadales bacterium]
MPRTISLLALAGVCVTALPAHAQRPLNLGFETSSVSYPDRAWGWTLGWSAFTAAGSASFVLDDTVHVEGARSLRISASDSGAEPPARELMLQVPAGFARGKVLRLTGAMRSTGLRGRAFLVLAAWGDQIVPAVDSGIVPGDESRGEWRRVALSIRVPPDPSIHSIVVAAGVEGTGVAWFDGLELQVDGTPVTVLPPDLPPPTPADIQWIEAHSAPLVSFRPDDRDDGDLALFDRIVGHARLVGLGESTHGTSEFFQVKHRLLEHLVQAQRFDLFAIEANQVAVERLNAFVLGGPGTSRDAMRVMFRVWNTEEMEALVLWMRRYNADHPDRPVRFVGYDMQDQQSPADSLLAFLARRDPDLVPQAELLTGAYRAQSSYATPQLSDTVRNLWRAQGDSLAMLVATRRPAWLEAAETRADSVQVEWAVHAADLYRQAARLNASLYSPDRDSLMAANLAWALRVLYPDARAVVWAHDVHVSHGGDAERSFNGGAQMGAYLKHRFALDYVAFSLLTAEGHYSATRSFTDHEVIPVLAFPAPEGSVEAALAAVPRPAGSPGLVVDLRALADGREVGWLSQPRPVRHVGYAAYDYGFDLQGVMPLEFDGIVFIENTTASRMLPTRR